MASVDALHVDLTVVDLAECRPGYLSDCLQGIGEVDGGYKTESSLGNVDRAHLAGEIVHILNR